jgi:hypothetical protein
VKFDNHLAAYLYEHKSLQLEGIGTFILDDKARVHYDQGKEVYHPIEGLEFIFDPKMRTDENIISFLVTRLHKIEPLIRSDLEYYLSNIRVLLNIGNPYTIEGIGTLIKNNQRIYEFTPGNFISAKEELNPKRENADHNYPVRSTFSAGRFFVTILIATAALAAIGGIAWGVFSLATKKVTFSSSDGQLIRADTMVQEKDTIASKESSATIDNRVAPVPVPASTSSPAEASTSTAGAGDTATYKMIFEITKSKERAHSRTAQLNRLNSHTQYDSVPIDDSVAYYRLFLRMKVAARDTTHVKDSLRTFFGKRIFMEKQKG